MSARHCLLAAAVAVGGAMCDAAPNTTATQPLEPMRGLIYSAADLARARENLDREPWRRKTADRVTKLANRWLKRDDAWIRNIMPPPGSIFAYGKSGCPACMARWAYFGRNTCSFDKPGKVTCPDCKRVFPDPDPRSPYHDKGTGIRINGQNYYLVGVWNAFVADALYSSAFEAECATYNLGYAYAFTGRDEYARKLITIMDALATLAPTTRGPRDFDLTGKLDSDQGRLHILTAQVYRCIAKYCHCFDFVARHPMLQEDSPTSPGVTMFENIRRGLFEDYLFKCFNVHGGNLETLHNIEADSTRGMLTVGLLFGNPDYIRWGMDELDAFIANTLDRDGMYYEISLGYAAFSRSLFIDMAEMCSNYSPSKYAGLPGGFPAPRNYFSNPRLRMLCMDNYDPRMAGHLPPFGDCTSDRRVVTSPGESFNASDWTHLARFSLYAPDASTRERARAMLPAALCGRKPETAGTNWWMFKMADPIPEPTKHEADLSAFGNARFMGTKGIGAFQSGAWPHRRGVAMRGGPNLPHGQDDALALCLFDLGRDLTAAIGYGTFGTHAHQGWARRAISHNSVVVDQDRHTSRSRIFLIGPGASWRSFHEGDTARFMDADASSQFPAASRVSQYRRRIVFADVDAEASYYIDVFDVRGGQTRDYSLHMPYNDELATNALKLAGVDPRPVPGAWTLAGLDPRWRNERWNAPGCSFGERLTGNEFIRKLDAKDKIGPYGWTPPASGYGFIYNLRGARTAQPFEATWTVDPGTDEHVHATVLPVREMEVYTGNAPDLLAAHLYNYLVCRDAGSGASRFVTVIEPYRGRRAIRSIRQLPGADCILQIDLADGRTDYVILGRGDAPEFKLNEAPVSGSAEFAFLRIANGAVEKAEMFRGSRLAWKDRVVLSGRPALAGTVESVDAERGTCRVKLAGAAETIPTSAPLFAIFDSPRYSVPACAQLRPSSVRIDAASRTAVIDNLDPTLQTARVSGYDEDGVVSSAIPLPLSYAYKNSTRLLDGRALIDAGSRQVGKVVKSLDMKAFRAACEEPLTAGTHLRVLEFAPGDDVELPLGSSFPGD